MSAQVQILAPRPRILIEKQKRTFGAMLLFKWKGKNHTAPGSSKHGSILQRSVVKTCGHAPARTAGTRTLPAAPSSVEPQLKAGFGSRNGQLDCNSHNTTEQLRGMKSFPAPVTRQTLTGRTGGHDKGGKLNWVIIQQRDLQWWEAPMCFNKLMTISRLYEIA